MISMWSRANTTAEEKKQVMLECGYPNTRGAGELPYNEIAEIHLCMLKKGFKKKEPTFCDSFPELPACIEAAKNKRA